MRILILGGTRFVGRHITKVALAKGHEVTLFYRGKSNPDLFPECEHIHGDRDQSLDGLSGRTWDVVIDTCAYIPRQVRTASELLRSAANHYIFISTISIYDRPYEDSPTESHKVIELEDPTVEEVNKETYGGLKVLCEREAAKHWGDNLWNVRPGIIVGPWDTTDRFTYWVTRLGRQEDFVAPPRLIQPVQGLDVRDLAEFILLGVEKKICGSHHVVGPSTSFEELFGEGHKLWPGLTAVRGQLSEEDIAALPMVLPADGSYDGIFRMDASAALGAGFLQRPIKETLADTWSWYQSQGQPALKVGLTPEREAEILKESTL